MDIEFQQFIRYWPTLLQGLAYTVGLSSAVAVAGAAGGAVVCFLRLRPPGALKWIARTYVGFFRTIPEMVLLFWIYYCLPILTDVRISTIATGVLGLALVASAYLGEIFRTGVSAVPKGQFEAGESLGLPRWIIWRKIVLPQAIPVISGPLVNYSADIVKNTSLLAALGVAEIMYNSLSIGGKTFMYFEFVTIAGLAYFAIIFPLSMFAKSRESALAVHGGRRARANNFTATSEK
ncbi:MAG: amino acid ABC transporter permease [Parvibaculaceae bacterium]